MQAMNDKLSHFLNKTQQFTIPIFQRKYSWTEEQCKQLFEDIIRVGSSDEDNHFIGSIVYLGMNDDVIPTYRVIDGQQRITTISLLIAALAKYLLKNPNEDILMTPKKLVKYYLINDDEEGDLRYKLKLTKDDKKTLERIIDNIFSDEELDFGNMEYSQRIVKNHNYFLNEINEENVEFVYEGFRKLLIIIISLKESIDNPQLIFESLNSTGLPLTKADLIRNYILIGLTPLEQDKVYKDYWYEMESVFDNSAESFDRFIKDYLTIKLNRIPVNNKIYVEFKRFAQNFFFNHPSNDKFENIIDLVKDIKKYFKYLSKITMGLEENEDLNKALISLYNLGYKVSYPFLLNLYKDYDENKLDIDEFIGIVKYTESYLFRRLICEIPTASLNKTFATLYLDLDKENYLESFKALLLLKESSQIMPNNKEFKRAFLERDIYNLSGKNKEYIFDKFENWNSKEKTNINSYTIEHIMPQNPNLSQEWIDMLGENYEEVHKKYLHTIGNLTLTGYNSELSDKPFQEKRDMGGGFKLSAIRLNIYLQDLDTWNGDEILKRSKHLIKQAYTIWEYPKVSEEVLEYYKPEDIKKIPKIDVKEMQIGYWTKVSQKIDSDYEIFNSRKPNPQNWYNLAIGSSLAEISLIMNAQDNEIRSQIWIPDNKELFDYLEQFKEEIELELGLNLSWDRLDEYKASRIVINTLDFNLKDNINEAIEWQLDAAEKLYGVFSERIKNFKPISGEDYE